MRGQASTAQRSAAQHSRAEHSVVKGQVERQVERQGHGAGRRAEICNSLAVKPMLEEETGVMDHEVASVLPALPTRNALKGLADTCCTLSAALLLAHIINSHLPSALQAVLNTE